jgi:hypothetical protein
VDIETPLPKGAGFFVGCTDAIAGQVASAIFTGWRVFYRIRASKTGLFLFDGIPA